MNASKPVLQKDELHDSWVEVQDGDSGQNSPKKDSLTSSDPTKSGVYMPLNIEKLLKDAQKESNNPSRESSARGSPKGLHSPTNETPGMTQESPVEMGTDWIWDWSSGPERNPSTDMAQKFRRPVPRRMGIRNNGDQSLFTWGNLRILILSHTFCFAVGAVSMLVFLRKYCHWSRVTIGLD